MHSSRTYSPQAEDSVNNKAGVYLPNMGDSWNEQRRNFARMGNALADGTLVVMGSSELSSHDLRFVPYRFFPAELGVPTFAYGHAMLQSYGILRVLQSLSPSLTPHTKLVIMLSPAWFAADGQLSSTAFAEHISGPVLTELWAKPPIRNALIYWIKTHQTWGILNLMAQTHLAHVRDQIEMWLTGKDTDQPPAYTPTAAAIMATRNANPAAPLPQANWRTLLGQARLSGAQFGTNPYLVRNEYYKTHLLHNDDPEHNEFAHRDPLFAQEFADLSRLMEYLQHKQIHAYFVLQPLNTKLVLDTDRFVPTADSIMAMCKRYDMACLNLYAIKTVPGIFRDDMHLAELGWALADQGINTHFSQ